MYLNDVPKYFQFSINFNNIVSICVQFSILKKMRGWRAPLQCPPWIPVGRQTILESTTYQELHGWIWSLLRITHRRWLKSGRTTKPLYRNWILNSEGLAPRPQQKSQPGWPFPSIPKLGNRAGGRVKKFGGAADYSNWYSISVSSLFSMLA